MSESIPARRIGADGRARVDWRAIIALAWPLMLYHGLNGVLDLTDMWFVSRLSVDASAAMASVYLPNVVFQLLLGGPAMAVTTYVAQAYGAGARTEAAGYVWTGVWCAALVAPVFIAVGWHGGWAFHQVGIADGVAALAGEYWWPRLMGGPTATMLWALLGFFNGVGASRVAMAIMVTVAVMNAPLNALFMFTFGLGMAGAAWGTVTAQFVGLVIAAVVFLTGGIAQAYLSRRPWRPRPRLIGALFVLGVPTGLSIAVDLIGATLFQFMMVRLGSTAGAASQIVTVLTSLSYWPAIGIALAGTTLVGQSIGAGDKDWARRMGDAVTLLCVVYMGGVALILALAGAWVLPAFASPGDPNAAEMLRLGASLIWFAVGYQVFDGVQFGRSFGLRGAGDQRVPALMLVGISWVFFVPLAHMLTFAPGQGWVDGLPQFGYGAQGGWAALLIYVIALAIGLDWRWRSGAWRRIALR